MFKKKVKKVESQKEIQKVEVSQPVKKQLKIDLC